MIIRAAIASSLAVTVLLGTHVIAGAGAGAAAGAHAAASTAAAAAPPQLRTAESGHLVASGASTFDDGTRDYVAVVGATASGIGRGFAGPRVRALDVPRGSDADGDARRSASVLELIEGFAWMRLTPPGSQDQSAPGGAAQPAEAHGLPSGLPTAEWMFSDDPATQMRAFFPLLTYPFFLTRRVAGGAAGTELIVLVADETDTRCSVWVVYPGPRDDQAKASAEIAFHPWDVSRDAPAASLERIDLPAGSYVRVSLQKRGRGDSARGPALWYADAAPRPAPIDDLDASSDEAVIAAIRAADGAAGRAMNSRGERPPAGRRTFRGFSLEDA